MRNGLLYNGNEEEILPHMGGVRFAEKKVKYIVEARRFFTRDGSLLVKSVLRSFSNIESLRIWLVKNLKGIGMKEASHFLRNVGLGKDLAILDRHILRNLVELGILKGLPKNLTRKQYLEIEQKLRSYATMVGIPMDELDLLLWSQETGEVFK